LCGRYDNVIARDAYRGLFKAQRIAQSNFPPRYNIAPPTRFLFSASILATENVRCSWARWGLIPFWMKEKTKVPHINARAETVDKLPVFQEAFAKRRCLFSGNRLL